MSIICVNVSNAARRTHDRAGGQVYFPASRDIRGHGSAGRTSGPGNGERAALRVATGPGPLLGNNSRGATATRGVGEGLTSPAGRMPAACGVIHPRVPPCQSFSARIVRLAETLRRFWFADFTEALRAALESPGEALEGPDGIDPCFEPSNHRGATGVRMLR